MKKIISLVLVLGVFAICSCSCSDKGKNNSSISDVQSEINSEIASNVDSEEQTASDPKVSSNSKPQTNNQSKPSVNDNSQNASDVASKKPPLVDMENLSPAVLEKFTDKQLEWVHTNAEKFPENFVFANLSGYFKIIESASSRDEAVENAKEKFTTTVYDVVKCEILSETDNFYTVYVKWVPKGEPNSSKFREEKVVCFKESVFDVDSKLSEGEIFTKDKALIKNIFDYCYYTQYVNLGGYKVLYSEVTENKNGYKYTVYFVGTVYGDKGIMDDVSLYKQETIIEKDGKEFDREDKVTIKKIGVIGEGYDGEGGFVAE